MMSCIVYAVLYCGGFLLRDNWGLAVEGTKLISWIECVLDDDGRSDTSLLFSILFYASFAMTSSVIHYIMQCMYTIVSIGL